MTWQIVAVVNGGIGIGYLLICLAIIVPLVRTGRARSNPLGAATAAVFFTGAVHHVVLVCYLLLPPLGLSTEGGAARSGWPWPLALWDAAVLLVAIYYWTLRRDYAPLLEGTCDVADAGRRQQQAWEWNDSVLQGLVVAKMALDLDDPERAEVALSRSIDSASRMITELLGSEHAETALVRSGPADVGATPDAAQPRDERSAR